MEISCAVLTSPDESVDLVVSNRVLNLVRDESKRQLIQEMYLDL